MDKEVVTELIQERCNTKNLRAELRKILDSSQREQLLEQYDLLEEKLGGVGASEKTARLIIRSLK